MAYKFLNQLGDVELACIDPEAFVCRDDDGGVQALFWDFTITHPGPSVINQEYYAADQPAKAKEPVQVKLSGLEAGDYDLIATKVGYRSNDVDTVREAISGAPVVKERIRVMADGKFARRFEMRENDVWLVELRRR